MLFTSLLLVGCEGGLQAQTSSASKPATASAAQPTEATVDSFLKQMFGWNQDLTWKIARSSPQRLRASPKSRRFLIRHRDSKFFACSLRPIRSSL